MTKRRIFWAAFLAASILLVAFALRPRSFPGGETLVLKMRGKKTVFDKANAAREGRSDLGGDIMIHGSNASIGCLAMGDEVAEDLFVLAGEIGRENVEVRLCPADFRAARVLAPANAPPWTAGLYRKLAAALPAR